jgi:hypothetical protein
LKSKLLYILILFSKTIFGQSQEFKNSYIIHPGTELILTDYNSKKETQATRVRLSIFQVGKALPFVKIKFQNTLEVYSSLTNEQGEINLELPAGNYLLEVTSPIFSTYQKVVKLQPNEELKLDFKVVNFEDKVTIYSKIALSKEEIEALKKCISTSKNKNNCFDNNIRIFIDI